jgi:NTP pyrophosphatase (non-canonical NTP hydrolase)
MSKIDLKALRDRAYKIACNHGFHDKELSNEHWFCLVISELMEAVEADRKGKRANVALFKEWQGNNLPVSEETRIRRFTEDFEEFIKDTVEDELSDAAIRLLDLSGLRGLSLDLAMKDMKNGIDDMAEACKDETFTESVYSISTLPVRYDSLYDFATTVNDMLMSIFGFAQHLGIDLHWFIEQKMKYNELRPLKHGKKY